MALCVAYEIITVNTYDGIYVRAINEIKADATGRNILRTSMNERFRRCHKLCDFAVALFRLLNLMT